MTKSFNEWLIEQQYRTDLVGELSEQALREPDWPKTNTRLAFEVYLHHKDATEIGRRAFYMAYKEWQKSRHLPTINMWMRPSKSFN
jgi:uncharacterized protein YozE (UPF0346 family)